MAIRQLRPGERIPIGEPNRYRNRDGYVRLRWKVGTRSYVETYEHRVLNGRVTKVPTVRRVSPRHPSDNCAENLIVLSEEANLAEHLASLDVDATPLVRMYRAGWTVAQISEDTGFTPSMVGRVLRRAGFKLVGPQAPTRAVIDAKWNEIVEWHREGVPWNEMARRLGVGSCPFGLVLKERGLTPRPRGQGPKRRLPWAQS